MYPFVLKPMYDKRVWGNNQIPAIRGVKEEGVAASWEISAHKTGSNIILNGELKGMTLQEAMNKYEKEILGKATRHDLLRCAISDAKEGLSIQNHPTDAYAIPNEEDLGKTESWYVIDAMPGATLIAGCKCKSKEEVLEKIQNNTIMYDMNYIPVRPGDFVQIHSGELHALGGGIMILEIANNSDVTYRLYDYARKDKNGKERELHLNKGMDILDLEAESEQVHHPITNKYREEETLITTDRYSVTLQDVEGSVTLENKDTFSVLHVVRGKGMLTYREEKIELPFLQSVFIPADCKEFKVEGDLRIIRAYPIVEEGE